MLKQTIVCLLSCGLLFSATGAISQSSYSHSASEVFNNCQMKQGLFSLDKQCIKKNTATYKGLNNQYNYLKKTWRSSKRLTNESAISRYQLVSSIKALLKWYNGDENLADYFELHNLRDEDGNNTVEMTGYYTPVLSASRFPSKRYQYPIYRVPTGNKRFFSRKKIALGALANLDLEIAWVEDPIELFYAHMQGSIILQFPDGEQRSLRYAASNDKPFRTLSSYIVQHEFLTNNLSRQAITQWLRQHPTYLNEALAYNPRYVFFQEYDSLSTASGMTLIDGHSVAVDTRYIPFGSVLLAEIPVGYTFNNSPVYEWRLLFPQDRGIAIKGTARLDLYTGKGESAREIANKVTGARRVYLLLSKPNAEVAMDG